MTVPAVSAAGIPPVLSLASSPVGQLRTTVLSAVAGSLNMSVGDLQGRLRAGQSLAEVARAGGMSRDDLTTVMSHVVASSGRVSADLTVDEVVQRLADQRRRTLPAADQARRPTPAGTGDHASADSGAVRQPGVAGQAGRPAAGRTGTGGLVDLQL